MIITIVMCRRVFASTVPVNLVDFPADKFGSQLRTPSRAELNRLVNLASSQVGEVDKAVHIYVELLNTKQVTVHVFFERLNTKQVRVHI